MTDNSCNECPKEKYYVNVDNECLSCTQNCKKC